MLTALWSHKAGSGVSTTAAAMAVECVKFGEDVLLVDFGGDLPSILGVDAPAVGVAQLVAPLADGRADSVDAVARVAESVGGGLWLIGRGLDTSLNERHIDVSDVARFMARLRADHRRVIVDMGDVAVSAVGEAFLQMADRSILISRLCGLSLHRWSSHHGRPSGVVVLREPGRTWRAADVAGVVGAPLVGLIDADAAVARAVDRSDLTRTPLRFRRSIRRLAEAVV